MRYFLFLGLLSASSQYVSALSNSGNIYDRNDILEREKILTNSISDATNACKKFMNDNGSGDRLQEIKVDVENLMKDIKNSNELTKEKYEKIDEAGQALIDELQKMIASEVNDEIKTKLSLKQKNLRSKLKNLREKYSSPNTSKTDLYNSAQDFGKLLIQEIDLVTGMKQSDELSDIGKMSLNSASTVISKLTNLPDEKMKTEQMKNSLGNDQVPVVDSNERQNLTFKITTINDQVPLPKQNKEEVHDAIREDIFGSNERQKLSVKIDNFDDQVQEKYIKINNVSDQVPLSNQTRQKVVGLRKLFLCCFGCCVMGE